MSTSERAARAAALLQVADGNRKAFEEVYRLTSAKLFGICLRILPTRHEAEGAAQGVYIALGVGQFANQLLADLGYRTRWVTSAEEALDNLGANGNGFDVVFSDVVMLGMGGIELAERLSRDMPNLPVILASGYSHVLATEGAEGIELLKKPYSAAQLSNVLQRRFGG